MTRRGANTVHGPPQGHPDLGLFGQRGFFRVALFDDTAQARAHLAQDRRTPGCAGPRLKIQKRSGFNCHSVQGQTASTLLPSGSIRKAA